MQRLFARVKQLKISQTWEEEKDGQIIRHASDHYTELASSSVKKRTISKSMSNVL